MALTRTSSIPYSAKSRRSAPRTKNNNIVRLHEFFSKIVSASGENADLTVMKIAKHLTMSKRNRPAVKLSKVVEEVAATGKVAVVVAKILDDERVLEIPAVKIVALQWSKTAQQKIEANGGSISTLDQFIRVAGSMDNIHLIKGDPNARKSTKFFGPAPGEKGSATYPRQTSKGKNKEKRINAKKPVVYEDSDSE